MIIMFWIVIVLFTVSKIWAVVVDNSGFKTAAVVVVIVLICMFFKNKNK